MRSVLFCAGYCCAALLVNVRHLPAQEPRTVKFDKITFESGVTVPNVRLVYQIRGALNKDKSNAILLPSHYAANHTGYDALIGPGKELDPAKYCLILTDMFANGVSSSPNNTPPPFDGPRFPLVSIRDNVNAQSRLVRESLGIARLKAVVGFSMGAQQAYQWAVSYPDMMDSIVVICGNAKQYPFGVIRLQGSIDALKADAAFRDGNYTAPPIKGLRAIGMHYRAWAISPSELRREEFDGMSDKKREETLKAYSAIFLSADANNLLSQAETWKRHNVGDSPGCGGKLETALHSIKARVLLMPSTTDQYFPLADSVFESKMIADAIVAPIESTAGHTAGGGADPKAAKFIDATLKEFFNPAPPADTPAPPEFKPEK